VHGCQRRVCGERVKVRFRAKLYFSLADGVLAGVPGAEAVVRAALEGGAA